MNREKKQATAALEYECAARLRKIEQHFCAVLLFQQQDHPAWSGIEVRSLDDAERLFNALPEDEQRKRIRTARKLLDAQTKT